MKEIEILVELKDDYDKAYRALSKYEFKGSRQTIDTYYFDPIRPNLKLNDANKLTECCRVREIDGKFYIAYKTDVYEENIWKYSKEYETEIGDIITIKKILASLGLKELVKINNKKHTFETPDYEIVLEEVVGLGVFVEVEYKQNDFDKRSVDQIRKAIFEFIQQLGFVVGEELNSGKPELLLLKKIKTL